MKLFYSTENLAAQPGPFPDHWIITANSKAIALFYQNECEVSIVGEDCLKLQTITEIGILCNEIATDYHTVIS